MEVEDTLHHSHSSEHLGTAPLPFPGREELELEPLYSPLPLSGDN